ncbi:MAG TPA: hypothetical protein VJO53_00190 [Candidatus Acidoferrales bacterium]|nr:hypothetical protein [Candidatus Acidoferrales bacterium]
MTKRDFNAAHFLPALAVAIVTLLSVVSAQEPAAVPVESEPHHHVVFSNSYVRVLFVEIPGHESTLLHHHDLPYVTVPLGGAEAIAVSQGAAAQPGTALPRVGYRAGGFSHAVTNPRDAAMRIVAIQLVRPQGTIRNDCAAVIQEQPAKQCGLPDLGPAHPLDHETLYETDEILVEAWNVAPNVAASPGDAGLDMLISSLSGVSVTAGEGIDSANAIRGGLLWVPAGSKPVFRTAPDQAGRLVAITFKDSAPAGH